MKTSPEYNREIHRRGDPFRPKRRVNRDRRIPAVPSEDQPPDPSGRRLVPSQGGDTYSYVVDTFAVVLALADNGRLWLEAKDGRQFSVRADDLNLRRAGFWDRWWHQNRFPDATSTRTA